MEKAKTKKTNRNKSLKNIQNAASDKAWFRIAGTRKQYPGQLVRLYSNTLENNFPGQVLKELSPSEYVKQMHKLQVAKNLKTRKYNKPATKPKSKRGPGSRGSLLRKSNESYNNWMKRLLGV